MAISGVEVHGLRELDGALDRVSGYQGQLLRQRAILKGARVLVRPMRNEAPQGATGNLRKAVAARKGRGVNAGRDPNVVVVGSTAPHRHLVIRGTVQRATRAGANRGRMPANPFVDRAWAANRGRVLAAIEAAYAAEVKQAWHR